MIKIQPYTPPQQTNTPNSGILALVPSKIISTPNDYQNPDEGKSKSNIWQTLFLSFFLILIPNCGNHQPQTIIQPQLIIYGGNNIDTQISFIKLEKNTYQTNNY